MLGLWAATLAAARRARDEAPGGPALPLGALVVVALAAYWDFATSGLETGLIIAWLGISALALTRIPVVPGDPNRAAGNSVRVWPAALLFGLGPLVRPDLAIPAGAFLAALVLVVGRRPLRTAALAATAAALPAAYQVFRMGYFAVLVPNTAIAKEASAARWDQGLRYLVDFAGPYWLWLPLAALACCWLVDAGALLRPSLRKRAAAALAVLPALGGVLHALYVIRVGGDFMHARLLLPSLFAVLLPVMAVPVRLRHVGRHSLAPSLLAAAVVVPWALVCALWLRPPYHAVGNGVGPQGIADERWFYVQFSGHPHPVTLADYDRADWKRAGDALRLLAERERVVLPVPAEVSETVTEEQRRLLPAHWVPARVVLSTKSIGLLGYAAGPRVHVVDRLGLADPIAARLRLARRGRPGHEKELPAEWVVARFVAPEALHGGPETAGLEPAVQAAGAALQCGALEDLLQAVQAPLTPERFGRNVLAAWRLTALRLPSNPVAARAELCAPGE